MLSPLMTLGASSPAPAVYGLLSGTGSTAVSAVANRVVFDMSPSGESLLARYEGSLSSGNETQQIRISLRAARSVRLAAADYILSYDYHNLQTKKDHTEQLRALHQHYMILDDSSTIVELFEAEPALYQLLIDAVAPLRHAFGDKRVIHIRVQSSDEDSILKVAVQLPATFEGDPERALQSFDAAWWLHNCHRSGGVLVFDYETHNAI